MRHAASGKGIILMLAMGLCLTSNAHGQAPPVRIDTSPLVVRTPPPDVLAPYRGDPAFDYERSVPERVSLWARIKAWVWEHIFRPLGASAMQPFWRFVYYAVVAGAMTFLLLRLLRMDVRGVFRGKRHRASTGDLFQEHPASLDLDARIEEAVAGSDYRRAVRLLYLKALRELDEQNLIVWRWEKTNQDYIDELRNASLRRPFVELTYLFEYIWYGAFPADAAAFGRMRRVFARLHERLDGV